MLPSSESHVTQDVSEIEDNILVSDLGNEPPKVIIVVNTTRTDICSPYIQRTHLSEAS